MAGKFRTMTDNFSLELNALFSRSIRRALLAGLTIAVQTTKHDSSNAAAHWLIAAKGKSRPGARTWGKLRDLRGTAKKSATAPVGKRRDAGKNAALTQRFVRDRELREVIEKMVAGRTPETVFYFYNAVPVDSEYERNANIDDAGRAAVQEVQRQFTNAIEAGNVRKAFR